MVNHSYFFTFVIAILGINLAKCAEFVPVYMWGTTKMSEHVPALHKTSEDTFKDTLLEYLKGDPYVIVFAEHTLSPEDFAQRDQNGDTPFPNISNLKKLQAHVTYNPYVQNPIGAIKQLDKKVTELSIGSLLNSPNVPKNDILIIDFNDAKDDEQRFHMLKRHDSDIESIYKDISEQHENVLAIYTAHHTSWVAPEEITHKKSRKLLAEEEPTPPPVVFSTDYVLMYLNSSGLYKNSNGTTVIDNKFKAEASVDGDNATLTLNGPIEFVKSILIKFVVDKGYWFLKSVQVEETNTTTDLKVSNMLYAPLKFSYHCGDLQLLSTKPGEATNLTLPGFQIEFTSNASATTNRTFGDAYDCVGFTSIPIWSALFVTMILLLIMTFGLTMMMDIRTMDRFDDPKGKTITINAAE